MKRNLQITLTLWRAWFRHVCRLQKDLHFESFECEVLKFLLFSHNLQFSNFEQGPLNFTWPSYFDIYLTFIFIVVICRFYFEITKQLNVISFFFNLQYVWKNLLDGVEFFLSSFTRSLTTEVLLLLIARLLWRGSKDSLVTSELSEASGSLCWWLLSTLM